MDPGEKLEVVAPTDDDVPWLAWLPSITGVGGFELSKVHYENDSRVFGLPALCLGSTNMKLVVPMKVQCDKVQINPEPLHLMNPDA